MSQKSFHSLCSVARKSIFNARNDSSQWCPVNLGFDRISLFPSLHIRDTSRWRGATCVFPCALPAGRRSRRPVLPLVRAPRRRAFLAVASGLPFRVHAARRACPSCVHPHTLQQLAGRLFRTRPRRERWVVVEIVSPLPSEAVATGRAWPPVA